LRYSSKSIAARFDGQQEERKLLILAPDHNFQVFKTETLYKNQL